MNGSPTFRTPFFRSMLSQAKSYLQRHILRLEFLRTQAAVRITANNKYRDDTTKDNGQQLHVGDKVLLKQHSPGRIQLLARYHDSLYTVVATPEVAGTYTASEVRLYLASKTEQVGAAAVTEMDAHNDVTVPDTQSGTLNSSKKKSLVGRILSAMPCGF
ncbi:hypothetical protein PoB_006786300 [Plakobranchus ocellatus]|uniref:Uncharacterized protein n=1 Tax=Plakobranchus ocellatus TaxID=259542 RepID=A0AAV4DAX9_9GAST|nr:hypothetical protein PoB_006786300 [Plakobranchus ocellatus]